MSGGYGQFCPVSKAAEILCERWTILVVREVLSGSSRFSEIERGVPGIPPATLSKRLKRLIRAGVIRRIDVDEAVIYEPTEAGIELMPIVLGMGEWGQRWVRTDYTEPDLDADFLLWDVRRYLDPAGLPVDRAVVQLDIRSPRRATRCFWVVVSPGDVDLCMVDPAKPVDVVVGADLRALTEVWMGETTFDDAVGNGLIDLAGSPPLARAIGPWIGRHPDLAHIERGARDGAGPAAPLPSI